MARSVRTYQPPTGRRRRAYRILRLFASLVLSFLVQYLRARLSGRSYDFFSDSARNRKRAIKIREEALALGGVLIKVGQFLSSRVDLLPTEYIEELALLQDEVPPVSFAEIQPVLEESLGGGIGELFAEFDREPIAAASLGQVYRATLPTGQVAAVKVQRPHIDQIVEADLAALRYIVLWLDRFEAVRLRVDLPLILREFEETLRMELDYHLEGHHAERLSLLFQSHPQIASPRIYWSHSRGRVLSMQFMTGIKVSNYQQLDLEGISRSVVAELLMRAYLMQILQAGFFHADPHPGNILVRPGPTVVFLDFGMVGQLSPQMRGNIRDVFIGVIRKDFDLVLNGLDRLGFLTRNADRAVLKRALVWTVNTFYELSFGDLKTISPQMVLDELQDVFYSESFQIPANFAFLGRALGTLSGLCTALDPSFQFVTVAEPYARELVQGAGGVRGFVDQVTGEARNLALAAYALPYQTRTALERFNSGELDFRREFRELNRSITLLERAMRRLLYGLLLTGFLVAGAYVFPQHHHLFSLAAFVVAFVLALMVLASFRRRR